MRKQLTAEQVAKSEERKANFRALCKQVAGLSDDARAALASRCLAVNVEGHTLSQHNQCMIAMQCPTATIVGGFRQWINNGRAVRKGEHGITIWVPAFKKGDEGQPDEKRFVMGTIFDVSQTEEIEQPAAVCAA